ncbi:MAG: DNA-binding MarR family transcriptional regulator [Halioglobus sp.]|jgi:DNA-binding MarR family transcriptional regulator
MKKIPQEMSFIINSWSVNSILSKKIDAGLGAVHGIGFTEYMILFHLSKGHNKAMRRIDLASSIGLTASGITRLVSPMEKIGLVQKERNERDARVSLVKITPAGETILGDATTTLRESANRLLDGINQDSLTYSLEVLKFIGKDVYV